ncbi:MAG: sugar phosphate isomerase, partial [Armatimonadota bacterium]|nr:sugar phosphate isomerase [Armatimonadota bacterium]
MAPDTPADRAEKFLRRAAQFRLGKLLTEQPHPRTANLSQTARESIPAALKLLFDVDRDVVETYRRWAAGGTAGRICTEIVQALRAGGRLFFTGCGATGRLSIQLDSIWRDFWQHRRAEGDPDAARWEDRTVSVMAGGDFALIRSVEGFEDYAQFGRRQVRDRGLRAGDVLFAITEGGETSFVIG